MSILWCSFCCDKDKMSKAESRRHEKNFGSGCPHRTAPCEARNCNRGDHDCVTPSLSRIGCEGCRWTGYCPKCKGCGDVNPMDHHKREYQNEAKRAARRRAKDAA